MTCCLTGFEMLNTEQFSGRESSKQKNSTDVDESCLYTGSVTTRSALPEITKHVFIITTGSRWPRQRAGPGPARPGEGEARSWAGGRPSGRRPKRALVASNVAFDEAAYVSSRLYTVHIWCTDVTRFNQLYFANWQPT